MDQFNNDIERALYGDEDDELHGKRAPGAAPGTRGDYIKQGAFLHEVMSAKTLATGTFDINFFDGQNEVFGLTYNKNGTNPFKNGRGSLLALTAEMLAPTGVPLDFSASAFRTAYAQLQKVGVYTLKKNGRELHMGAMASIMPDCPSIISAVDVGTPVNTTRDQFPLMLPGGTLAKKAHGSYALHMPRPINWNGVNEEWELRFTDPSNRGVTSALNGYVMIVRALFTEFPLRNDA